MARILLVGEDSSLLATRAEVLKRTGANITCVSTHQAKPLLESESFDIIVLCHSLPETVSSELVEVVNRGWPEMKILLVVSPVGLEHQIPGTDLTSSGEPSRLIEQTKYLLEHLPHHRLELVTKEAPLSDPNCKIANLKTMSMPQA